MLFQYQNSTGIPFRGFWGLNYFKDINFQFQIYEDDGTLLYTEIKKHGGEGTSGSPIVWTVWSVPIVSEAGLVTKNTVTSAGAEPFTVTNENYFKLTSTDSGKGGGGTLDGIVIT